MSVKTQAKGKDENKNTQALVFYTLEPQISLVFRGSPGPKGIVII